MERGAITRTCLQQYISPLVAKRISAWCSIPASLVPRRPSCAPNANRRRGTMDVALSGEVDIYDGSRSGALAPIQEHQAALPNWRMRTTSSRPRIPSRISSARRPWSTTRSSFPRRRIRCKSCWTRRIQGARRILRHSLPVQRPVRRRGPERRPLLQLRTGQEIPGRTGEEQAAGLSVQRSRWRPAFKSRRDLAGLHVEGTRPAVARCRLASGIRDSQGRHHTGDVRRRGAEERPQSGGGLGVFECAAGA